MLTWVWLVPLLFSIGGSRPDVYLRRTARSRGLARQSGVRVRCAAWVLWLALGAVSVPALAESGHGREPGQALPRRGAWRALKEARRAEKKGEWGRAYLYYALAAAQDPGDVTGAWARSLALRTRALEDLDYLPPDLASDEAAEPAPSDEFLGVISEEELKEAQKLEPPVRLQPRRRNLTLDLEGDARKIYATFAAAFGLRVVFDADFQPGKPTRFRLEDAGFSEALRIVRAATGTFIVPVSSNVFLVARDTPQKRQALEPTMAQVIPIPETVSVQEAQELARAVQQVMDIRRLVIDSGRRLVLVRDRVSKVLPAAELFRSLMAPRPEVVIEVEFLETADNSTLNYGFNPPTSLIVSFLPGAIPLAAPITLNLFGLTVADAELIASMSRNSTRSLLRAQLRSVSGQPATLHVGDRFPVQVNAYLGNVSGPGKVYVPPPQINFEDLGVVVKVTPYVHGDDAVTLEVEAEFKVLAGTALNGIPVIANRTFQATTRLKEGEWAVMSGLMKASEARTITGLWGLASIPYLGPLFRKTTTERKDGRTLLVLKPTIVRAPSAGQLTSPVWVGSETRPLTIVDPDSPPA